MPDKLKESDEQFKAMDILANTLAILANPFMHLLGYGVDKEGFDQEIEKTIYEAKRVQQSLINEEKK